MGLRGGKVQTVGSCKGRGFHNGSIGICRVSKEAFKGPKGPIKRYFGCGK